MDDAAAWRALRAQALAELESGLENTSPAVKLRFPSAGGSEPTLEISGAHFQERKRSIQRPEGRLLLVWAKVSEYFWPGEDLAQSST